MNLSIERKYVTFKKFNRILEEFRQRKLNAFFLLASSPFSDRLKISQKVWLFKPDFSGTNLNLKIIVPFSTHLYKSKLDYFAPRIHFQSFSVKFYFSWQITPRRLKGSIQLDRNYVGILCRKSLSKLKFLIRHCIIVIIIIYNSLNI